jgi:hypothetical protein
VKTDVLKSIILALKYDGFVKSHFYPDFVIPAKAGIQLNQAVLGSRLRGSDGFSDFLRGHQMLGMRINENKSNFVSTSFGLRPSPSSGFWRRLD